MARSVTHRVRAFMLPTEPEHLLRRYISISFFTHLALFLILIAAPALLFQDKFERREQITWINLPKGLGDQIGAGLKRSKGLPQTTIEEAKKPLAVPPPSETKGKMKYKELEEKKKATTMAEKKKQPKPKPAYKSQTDDALARLEKSVKTREPEAAQIPKELEEGGVPFGSTEGPFVMPDDPIYVLYQAKIRQKILDAWILPMSFVGKEIPYRCTLVVKIDAGGKVIRTEFEDRSGNEAFDQSAFQAIYRASPLDIPPEKLKTEALKEGFLIEFDPGAKAQL